MNNALRIAAVVARFTPYHVLMRGGQSGYQCKNFCRVHAMNRVRRRVKVDGNAVIWRANNSNYHAA